MIIDVFTLAEFMAKSVGLVSVCLSGRLSLTVRLQQQRSKNDAWLLRRRSQRAFRLFCPKADTLVLNNYDDDFSTLIVRRHEERRFAN